jgi:fatty acid desaturase
MFTTSSRTQLIVGIWFAAVIVLLAFSVVLGAGWSTMTWLMVLSVVPLGVALHFGPDEARPMTTHELLYAVDSQKDARS